MVPSRGWVVSVILALSLLALAKERQADGSLSVEIPASFDAVAHIVSDVASDGIIRGTAEYKTESQLSGAELAESSQYLTPNVPQGAKVFYKVRPGTLAPRNYKDSEDKGTLVIAYIVEKIDAENTRLRIESVYVPDTHHGRSTSDGSVEACEFTAIETQLKTLAQDQREAAELKEKERKEVEVRKLRRELADDQARYDALNAEVQELQKRSAQLRALSVVKTKSAAARLQSSPYAHAETMQALAKGQELDVLYRTPSWYRVRTSDGQVGWVYASFLEEVQ
jgi:Bacterial SH3 domain